jgi:hypothetical protein
MKLSWCSSMDRKSWMTSLTTSTPLVPKSISQWRLNRTPSLPVDWNKQETRWLLKAHCVREAHPHQPVSECWIAPPPGQYAFCAIGLGTHRVMCDHKSLPVELEFFRIVHSNRTAIVTGRSTMFSNYLAPDFGGPLSLGWTDLQLHEQGV